MYLWLLLNDGHAYDIFFGLGPRLGLAYYIAQGHLSHCLNWSLPCISPIMPIDIWARDYNISGLSVLPLTVQTKNYCIFM